MLVLSEAGYESHECPVEGTLVIGRSRGCDIPVDDGSVSRRHAMLRLIDGAITITDLESANGTRVRDTWLEPGVAESLNRGESVRLGSAVVIVQDGNPSAAIRLLPRDYFESRVKEECHASARSRRPFTVFRITLDRELADDQALRAVGPALRASDTLGRWSGRELCVMVRGLTGSESGEISGRLLEAVENANASCRVGLASWPKDGTSHLELLSAAGGDEVRADDVVFGRHMEVLLTSMDRVALSDLTILLIGETGSGKEILAERVHRRSHRSSGPFLRLNCAALTDSLLESELFGHEKGAFTGADREKRGLLESANGGTVFLDEIGELSASIQVKLLRVLEERKVRRVGGLEAQDIDVRFVAATNRWLETEIERGTFRQDLYYRLMGARFQVPPLRDRTDEIVPLAELFLRKHAARSGTSVLELSPAAMRVLTTYQWPGNVRELRNLVEFSAVLCDGPTICPHHLPAERMRAVPRRLPSRANMEPADNDAPTVVMFSAKSQIGRADLVEALARHDGNQSKAAAELGIHRRTLMRKMDSLGIPRPRKGRR